MSSKEISPRIMLAAIPPVAREIGLNPYYTSLTLEVLSAQVPPELYDQVIIFDGRFELQEILKQAEKVSDGLVLLSLKSNKVMPVFRQAYDILMEKRKNPTLIVGGAYASREYEELMRRFPGIDAIVRFEGETAVRLILERFSNKDVYSDLHTLFQGRLGEEQIPNLVYRCDGVLTKTRETQEDLSLAKKLGGHPDNFLDWISGSDGITALFGLQSRRGCPYASCSFCNQFAAYAGIRNSRVYPAERIVFDIKRVIETTQKLEGKQPRADLFDEDILASFHDSRWHQVASLLEEEGLNGKVALSGQTRVSNLLDIETVRLWKRIGFVQFFIGVESGDPETLEVQLNKGITREQIIQAAENLKSEGLQYEFGWILAGPETTLEQVRNSLLFIKENNFVKHLAWSVTNILWLYADAPYVGSEAIQDLIVEASEKRKAVLHYRFRDERLPKLLDHVDRPFAKYKNLISSIYQDTLYQLISFDPNTLEGHLRLGLAKINGLKTDFMLFCIDNWEDEETILGEEEKISNILDRWVIDFCFHPLYLQRKLEAGHSMLGRRDPYKVERIYNQTVLPLFRENSLETYADGDHYETFCKLVEIESLVDEVCDSCHPQLIVLMSAGGKLRETIKTRKITEAIEEARKYVGEENMEDFLEKGFELMERKLRMMYSPSSAQEVFQWKKDVAVFWTDLCLLPMENVSEQDKEKFTHFKSQLTERYRENLVLDDLADQKIDKRSGQPNIFIALSSLDEERVKTRSFIL